MTKNTAAKTVGANTETTVNAMTVEVSINGKNIQVPTDEAMRKSGMTSLSSRIRHLESLGCSTSQIRGIVIRANGEHPLYQHVRNVLNTPLKKADASNAG